MRGELVYCSQRLVPTGSALKVRQDREFATVAAEWFFVTRSFHPCCATRSH
jgi:hypothetical protein